MLLVHRAKHLFSFYLQRHAVGGGCGGGHMQSAQACQRFLTDKFPGGKMSDGGFLAIFGNDGQLGAPTLEIKDKIGGFSLREEGLVSRNLTILRPSPALAKNASVSNADFSSSIMNIISPKIPRLDKNRVKDHICPRRKIKA